MQTTVYADVLLALNYIVTALLLVCTARLLGIQMQRRKIVTAALVGSVGSLTIFLPFMNFFAMMATRIVLSAAIVLAALPLRGIAQFLKSWFVFFAVNFFFAGVMLGIWMLFSPSGMLYYNGVVYFDISPFTLLISTIAAYLLLGLAGRMSRGGRLPGIRCSVTIRLNGKSCTLDAIVDSGNSLYEPFSGIPVIICSLDAVKPLLSPELAHALREGNWEKAAERAGTRIRLVPYAGVETKGALPALRLDELITRQGSHSLRTELVYMAVSAGAVGENGCPVILNPDLIASKILLGANEV